MTRFAARRHALRRAIGLGALWLAPGAALATAATAGRDGRDGRDGHRALSAAPLGWPNEAPAGTAAVGAAAGGEGAPLQWRERVTIALGTRIWLQLAHADAAQAEAALHAAVAAVQRVDAAASLFRDDSALQQLNRQGVLHHAPAELHALVYAALRVAAASRGRFDPTVQPLWRAWFEAQGGRPGAGALASARARLGWQEVDLGPGSIRLPRPGMALTLNGIVQGFAADQALAAVRRHGVEHALIDTGEWWPLGQDPEGRAWRLGAGDVADVAGGAATGRGTSSAHRPASAPLRLPSLVADGRALACSSSATLRFTADGAEHHILDPRTGHSPRELAMVVVAAPSALQADALSKPLMMGSAAQAQLLARRFGVDVLTVDHAGRWRASAGMRVMT